ERFAFGPPPSEGSTDPELKHGVRVELLVRQRPVDRQLHFYLHVYTAADLNRSTRRHVEPIAAAHEDRRSLKDILLTMQPPETPERHDAVRANLMRHTPIELGRGTGAQSIAVFIQRRARR